MSIRQEQDKTRSKCMVCGRVAVLRQPPPKIVESLVSIIYVLQIEKTPYICDSDVLLFRYRFSKQYIKQIKCRATSPSSEHSRNPLTEGATCLVLCCCQYCPGACPTPSCSERILEESHRKRSCPSFQPPGFGTEGALGTPPRASHGRVSVR